MLTKKVHQQIHLYSAILIAFTLPFAALTAIFIVLMLLNWIFEADFKNKWIQLKSSKLAFVFMGLYLLHLLGMYYTHEMKAGTFDLEVKLSLLIMPLVIATKPFSRKQLTQIAGIFILSCILVSICLLIRAVFAMLTTGENQFFYQAFSIWMHPSYFALYLGLAAILSIYLYQEKKNLLKLWMLLTILIYLSFIIVLLSSKMGLAVWTLLFLGILIYLIFSQKKYLIGIVTFVFGIVVVFTIFNKMPAVGARIKQLFTTVNSSQIDLKDTESSAVRLLIWSASKEVISDHYLIGVGTGDVKYTLMETYKKKGMTGAYEKKLNAHNTYLQIFIALGIPGIGFLLLSLILPLIQCFKKQNRINKTWVYAAFISMLILNFLVESMLETQAGILFYAFFNSLFCFSLLNNSENKSLNLNPTL